MSDRQRLGLVLRLIGPLIEGAAVLVLVRWGGQERFVAGWPLEHWVYGAMIVGLILVVVGLFLSIRASRRPREEW